MTPDVLKSLNLTDEQLAELTAPVAENEIFSFDFQASSLTPSPSAKATLLGRLFTALINEWVGDHPARMTGPRIGTAYGERDKDGTFSVRLVFRSAQCIILHDGRELTREEAMRIISTGGSPCGGAPSEALF